jgi:hypothetical protein
MCTIGDGCAKRKERLDLSSNWRSGAHARIRTGDLLLTKEMLYRLSYVGAGAAQKILKAGRCPRRRRTRDGSPIDTIV